MLFWFLLIMLGTGQGIKTNKNNTHEKLSRNKRLTIASERNLWTKGIIPYTFDDSLPKERRKEYLDNVFPVYEKYSCIQFVAWTPNTATQYGLDHNNYLIFVQSPQCVSKLGNARTGGQSISCCKWQTCLHEVGHAVGLFHEQASPIRDDFVRINYENIIAGLNSEFNKQPSNTDTHGIYDYDSIMHYALKAWSSNKEPTITFLDSETKPVPKFANTEQYFYFFQEINEAYQCTNKCTDLSCYNGGYKAIVEGKCRCRCPEGLNPATQCTSLQREEYECGKIVNLDSETPTATIESPVIRRMDELTQCYWYIKSPANTRILLNFPIFKIRKQFEECEDEVSVKAYLPGLYGIPYCGPIFKKTVQSDRNILAFSFTQTPSTSSRSAFVAKVSFINEKSYCYNLNNRGINYAGTVNFAEDSSRCLHWDKVRHCQHNMFNIKDADKRLERNYCRNPDNSTGPWCYTNSDGCVRKFCDACNLGVCKDMDLKCSEYIKKNPLYCLTVVQAPSQCRKSCGFCDERKPLPSVSTSYCSSPVLPLDAAPVLTKAEYAVGDIVTIQCNHSNTEYQHITCLSNGNWSTLRYVCGTCLPGWSSYGDSCYKLFTATMKQEVAEDYCIEQHPRASLVVENGMNHDFITRLITNERGQCTPVWIGLRKSPDGNLFTWPSGIKPKWTNWFEDNVASDLQCVSIGTNCEWVKKWCENKQNFVCSYIRPEHDICANQRNDCAAIITRYPTFCTVLKNSFAFTYCAKTCELC